MKTFAHSRDDAFRSAALVEGGVVVLGASESDEGEDGIVVVRHDRYNPVILRA